MGFPRDFIKQRGVIFVVGITGFGGCEKYIFINDLRLAGSRIAGPEV